MKGDRKAVNCFLNDKETQEGDGKYDIHYDFIPWLVVHPFIRKIEDYKKHRDDEGDRVAQDTGCRCAEFFKSIFNMPVYSFHINNYDYLLSIIML